MYEFVVFEKTVPCAFNGCFSISWGHSTGFMNGSEVTKLLLLGHMIVTTCGCSTSEYHTDILFLMVQM